MTFEDGAEKHIGDPTETAIVVAAHKNGMEKDALNERYPRLAEIPFDSDRKLMTTVNQIDGQYVAIVKGAFDVMAKLCVRGGIDAAREVNDTMSADALRVLAIGYRVLDKLPEAPTSEALERDLTFLGLVGMIDPPRPEAAEAVRVCRKAGIKPVMITGDHVITASAIARELGILLDGDRAITGAELDAMSEEELDQQVEHISVYARVSPENKIRIVKAWQKKGQVVSMTGDGVNDAPALKAADIGCAMGITGTDVAKGAADMTLTDDNFATIVDAVREGRGIYSNIKKVVGFLLGTNISEVIVVFLSMCIWQISPFISIQLLWINLIGDSLPAIALGMEKLEPDVMDHKPRSKTRASSPTATASRSCCKAVCSQDWRSQATASPASASVSGQRRAVPRPSSCSPSRRRSTPTICVRGTPSSKWGRSRTSSSTSSRSSRSRSSRSSCSRRAS